ncbi:hypothetical protein TrCOL_g3291, partial [Triparma columacea]
AFAKGGTRKANPQGESSGENLENVFMESEERVLMMEGDEDGVERAMNRMKKGKGFKATRISGLGEGIIVKEPDKHKWSFAALAEARDRAEREVNVVGRNGEDNPDLDFRIKKARKFCEDGQTSKAAKILAGGEMFRTNDSEVARTVIEKTGLKRQEELGLPVRDPTLA